MVENKNLTAADYRPVMGSTYEAPTLEATAPCEDEEVIAVLLNRSESDDLDRLAQASAAQAREQGVELIRSHLRVYLTLNPESNYVTWIATLHPENAEVTIDPRFLIPGNPWATVFQQAKAAALNNNHQSPEIKNDDSGHTYVYLGGLIPMIIGFSLVIGAVACTFALQFASILVYLSAVFFSSICSVLPPFSIWTAALYVLPGGMLFFFQGLDVFLLLLDTVIVELLALLAYLLCTPLAFCHTVGVFYHQQIRRLPHFIRWACRKPFQCKPSRATFPFLALGVPARNGQAIVDEAP